ncbi:MAG TPA: ABC transporter ATP-binding protein [Candidatus Faeciplasma pullistercoris]|uniref:ABC transporter ATP-binding protein n=1 Tax=Candidatus Faeciplasma pullistercoris TaxID=2840800 RepID=A0A9D1GSK4_9FIRM|nr:ABC transporter ATP-binding protein [Candidatus Faeciplasma pullistercoris]
MSNKLVNDIKGRSGGAGDQRNEKLDKKRTKSVILRLSKYILKHKFLFLVAIATTLISNQLALMGPMYSGYAIDAMTIGDSVDFAAVTENIVKMLVCYIASGILSYLLAVLMVFISQKIVYAMRKELFEKLTTLPVGYFDTHPAGDIISRISYDIDTVNASLSNDLVQIMTSVYTVIGSLIFMWRISKPLIVVIAVTVPVSIIFTRYRSKKVRPLFHTRSAKLGELNGYAEEMLSGGRTICAYGREKEISGRFDKRNNDTMNAYYNAEYYGATLGPSVNFINNMSLSLVMILGGILYMYSVGGTFAETSAFFITLGGISQFVQYSRKFAGPINEFANIMNEFQSAFSAAERVFRIIDENPESADAKDAIELKNVEGNVELRHVDFSYVPGTPILKDINIKAQAGKTIAIVGPTGAGKTTIINLLMRFYDASAGEILVDGKNIEDVKRSSLRKAYTMVLQDTWLFGGTIFDNIAYGKENATIDDVREAARAARLETYIEQLPNGYYTMLSDNGVNISKGQKQLITIARAMLMDSHMLILDEATSNVDSRTEIKIQQAMAKLMKGKTSFVIAHRLSTIQNADLILVIQDGRISEQGNHEELMKKGGFYSTLYNSQFV